MYTDLGRPGDTFAVAGDRAIYFGIISTNYILVFSCKCSTNLVSPLSAISTMGESTFAISGNNDLTKRLYK